jgi:hypothetical protein
MVDHSQKLSKSSEIEDQFFFPPLSKFFSSIGFFVPFGPDSRHQIMTVVAANTVFPNRG